MGPLHKPRPNLDLARRFIQSQLQLLGTVFGREKDLNHHTHIRPARVILKMRIQLRGHPGGGLGAPAV